MAWRDVLACVTVVAGALSAAAIACSSFAGAEVAETPDAASEASTATDGDTTDARAEASDGGRAPFCDGFPDASFCFSFDDGSDPRLGAKLKVVSPPEPGLTDAAKSPPNALATEVDSPGPGQDGGPASGVRLEVTGVGTHAHCDLQVWADQLDPDASVSKANVDIVFVQAGGHLFDFSVVLESSTSIFVAQTGISGSHTMVSNLARATWTPIGIDLEVVGGQVSIHGSAESASSTPVSTTGPVVQKLGDIKMLFGQSFVTGHWTVRLDDLVCTWN